MMRDETTETTSTTPTTTIVCIIYSRRHVHFLYSPSQAVLPCPQPTCCRNVFVHVRVCVFTCCAPIERLARHARVCVCVFVRDWLVLAFQRQHSATYRCGRSMTINQLLTKCLRLFRVRVAYTRFHNVIDAARKNKEHLASSASARTYLLLLFPYYTHRLFLVWFALQKKLVCPSNLYAIDTVRDVRPTNCAMYRSSNTHNLQRHTNRVQFREHFVGRRWRQKIHIVDGNFIRIRTCCVVEWHSTIECACVCVASFITRLNP